MGFTLKHIKIPICYKYLKHLLHCIETGIWLKIACTINVVQYSLFCASGLNYAARNGQQLCRVNNKFSELDNALETFFRNLNYWKI